jgi:hypothetical protein
VGPNNSGKSLLLREVESIAEGGLDPYTRVPKFEGKILDHFEPKLPDRDEAERLLNTRQFDNPAAYRSPDPGTLRVYKVDAGYGQSHGQQGYVAKDIHLARTLNTLEAYNSDPEAIKNQPEDFVIILENFVSLFTIRLDGSTRLALTVPRPGGNIRGHAQNHLWALAQDDKVRARLREITYDAFGLYFLIDPTHMQTFHISMSDTAPPPNIELNLGPEGRNFLGQATDIADFSHGIKAFTGLAAALLSTDFRVMLIDEPEAFLHPVLARKLGGRLTELANDREGNVLAATHSPEFLMGCVEAGNVNVIRLTYRQEVPSARLLAASDLREMMRDPLLRSTSVLSALFHEGAVVCEGDGDRAFYQEINYRLLTVRPEQGEDSDEDVDAEAPEISQELEGADNSIFLNAHGKDPVPRIVGPLRRMGIPAAAIVDLDVLKNDFSALLTAALVPEDSRYSWGTHRGRVDGKLRSKDASYKTKGGIDLLDPSDRESAETLLNNLAEYGIFVVPTGELESWLKEWLNDSPAKKRWVSRVFELMGSEPTDPDYLKPQDGDVWGFMRKVGAWIADPNRKGMPA